MVKLKDFKVGDLFDVKTTKATNVKNVHFKTYGNCEFVGRTNVNNGVQSLVSADEFAFSPNEPNTITISQVGTITAQYRDKPYFTSQNIVKLVNNNLNSCSALYIVATLNKWLHKMYVGYHTPKLSDIKQKTIFLPVTTDGTPDWQYMHNRISELEHYLQVTGLNDYHLTNDDKEVLNKKVETQKFKVEDLFEKCNLKRIKKTFDKKHDLSNVKTAEFDLPLINAKYGNNGIMYYGRSKNWESREMTIGIINNGEIATGLVYAHPQKTGTFFDAYQINLIKKTN